MLIFLKMSKSRFKFICENTINNSATSLTQHGFGRPVGIAFFHSLCRSFWVGESVTNALGPHLRVFVTNTFPLVSHEFWLDLVRPVPERGGGIVCIQPNMPKENLSDCCEDDDSTAVAAEDDEDEPFDLDDLLPSIGEFGRYQRLLVFGICLPACIPCGFCAFNQLFMADTPEDYWCKVPELLDFPLEQRKYLAIPQVVEHDAEVFSKCYRYAVNWTDILENTADINELEPNSSWSHEKCTEGWGTIPALSGPLS